MKIIEMPREGMQSLSFTIPTAKKIKYIQQLLKVGFDTVEVGSIVSSKLVPQMADSLDVLHQLDFTDRKSNIMMLAVNKKSADLLAVEPAVTHISYPYSVSPTFLKHNLNTTTKESIDTVRYITNLGMKKDKQVVIYISMAFGNPYGDHWNYDMLLDAIRELEEAGAYVLPLSNVAIELDEKQISDMFGTVIPEFPDLEFGLHLHTTNHNWSFNVRAAYEAGCRRFDSVVSGFGGCPMLGREMLGNLSTENLISFAKEAGELGDVDETALTRAYNLVGVTFLEPFHIPGNVGKMSNPN